MRRLHRSKNRHDRPRRAAIRGVALAASAWLLSGCGGLGLQGRPGQESLLPSFFGGPAPVELATMAIDPYDANARYVGTIGLANAFFAGAPVYVALFADNIDDPDASVRAAAARGLANHGDPSHVPLLVTALSDADRLVRAEAARGLQRLHNPDAAVPALLKAIEKSEPDADVRAEAAHALGQYAERRVLQSLIAALEDPQLAVNRNALASLRTLTGQDFGYDRPAWFKWDQDTGDPFAAQSIYIFPAYTRDRTFIELIPFVPPPPNEAPAPPAGLPRG